MESNNLLLQCFAQLEQVVKTLQSSTIEEDEGGIAAKLGSKLSGRVAYGLRGLTAKSLENLNVDAAPQNLVLLESKVPELAATSTGLGNSEFWSSDALHKHLKMLKGFVATNEAGVRLWINAFFFRVHAMLNGTDKAMVLSVEQHVDVNVNPSTDLNVFVDYAALRGSKDVAGSFLKMPILGLKRNRDSLTLFVSEAKRLDTPLEDYLPQTAGEMYACAKALQKNIVRGALTDGRSWIFVIFKVNEAGGGTYYCTNRIRVIDFFGHISKEQCDLIAGIIAHWIDKSHQDLDESDWIAYNGA
ncbi:hypothetical protein CPB84DRAFT_1777743 [Gymnopilus junonius]|uniref:Uncharacterized protein n=1 Tax=Gymnopilus junonius TaxID=109634 RepID=A0A9P5NRE5_GYMJU|nr:hypothetical protein CPB84DRAFT_1777743 [Gymnopilus junonius]